MARLQHAEDTDRQWCEQLISAATAAAAAAAAAPEQPKGKSECGVHPGVLVFLQHALRMLFVWLLYKTPHEEAPDKELDHVDTFLLNRFLHHSHASSSDPAAAFVHLLRINVMLYMDLVDNAARAAVASHSHLPALWQTNVPTSDASHQPAAERAFLLFQPHNISLHQIYINFHSSFATNAHKCCFSTLVVHD